MTDAITEKLRKLLALANDKRNTSEEETNTAMRMAAVIAAKHGIDLASLRTADQPKVNYKRYRDELSFQQIFACEAAATMMGVRFYVYDEGRRGFEFVGRTDLIDMAEQLMFFLFSQIEAIYRQSLPKGLSKRARAEFRRTFKPACALRVRERAVEMMRDLRTNNATASAATGHNALVVAGYYDQLKLEIDEYERQRYALTPAQRAAYDKMLAWRKANPEEAARQDAEEKKAAAYRPRKERQMPTGSGTDVGYRAGDRVKLNKEVK